MSFLAIFKFDLETTLNDLQNDFYIWPWKWPWVTLAMTLALVGDLLCDIIALPPHPTPHPKWVPPVTLKFFSLRSAACGLQSAE